jgi:peptidoglycan/LPS O-acetylase OafA/YrhL
MLDSIDQAWYMYFFLMPVLLAVAGILVLRVPFYRSLLTGPQSGRHEALDGLRGLLATGVFFHHAVILYHYQRSGSWEQPVSPFYSALGHLSVALFFMITGFLFWSKAIARGGRIAPLPLYWSRLFRLAPLYCLSALLVCVIVAAQTHLQLREPLAVVGRELVHVWSLGMLPFTGLNGIGIGPINAGVTWTLQYEWLFYLLLPAMACMARPGRVIILFVLLVLAYELQPSPSIVCLLHFATGMATAHLVASRGPFHGLSSNGWWNWVPAAGALTVGIGVPTYSLAGVLCASVVFVGVVSGLDFWGLLRTRPMKLLGTVSYSIYLLHGIVMCLVFAAIQTACPVQRLSPVLYWGVIAGCGPALVCLSALTYRWLEHPFLRVPVPLWLAADVGGSGTAAYRGGRAVDDSVACP